MGWWDNDLGKLSKLVRDKFADLEAYLSPENPGTGQRDGPPPSQDGSWKPRETRGTGKAGQAGGGLMHRALALHALEDPETGHAAALLHGLEAQLAASTALNAEVVTAAGLVAAYRSQHGEARSLLELVDGFDRYADTEATGIALRWLAADAASRGDWRQAYGLRGDAAKDGLGQVAFFTALAAWHLRLDEGEGRVNPLELQTMADGMPDVANAQALVTAAISPGGPVPEALVHDAGLVGRTVALHATLRATPAGEIHSADVRELASLWDKVLRSWHVAKALSKRRSELGATVQAADVLERLRETVQRDLGRKLLDSHVDLSEAADGDREGVLGELIEGLEERLVAELDISIVALGERLDAKRDLSPLGECRQWLALKRQVDRLGRLCGGSGRLVAYSIVYPAVGSWSVNLWNERKARPLANAMFKWIADVAGAVEAHSVVETYSGNKEW